MLHNAIAYTPCGVSEPFALKLSTHLPMPAYLTRLQRRPAWLYRRC